MVVYKIAFSNDAPTLRNVVWAKPVSGGFALFLLENGQWKPLQSESSEDYTDEKIAALLGKNTDDKTKMTLHGLKAYIDDAIASITPSNP